MANEQRTDRIGSGWWKDGRKGKYLSLAINRPVDAGARVFVFENGYKRGDTDPDVTLVLAGEQMQTGDRSQRAEGKQPSWQTRPAYQPETIRSFVDDGSGEIDVPF